MNKLLLFFSIFFIIISCRQASKDSNKNKPSSDTEKVVLKMTLLDHVTLAINPKFQDWVLFENGTYIIFDKADTLTDIKIEAIKLMKEFGPVYAGSSAGDFSVTHLNKTDGWVVSGHCYGMYTYVNPDEFDTKTPSDVNIGLLGRSKREKDGKNPKIIHINQQK